MTADDPQLLLVFASGDDRPPPDRKRGRDGRRAASGRPHQVLLLLTDGLAGDQQEVVRGAYATLGAGTRLVGGCAGDGLRMEQTHQLWGTRS